MSEMKVGRVETVYPPEFHAAVQPLYQLIEDTRADVAKLTGLDDAALTATAMIDYRDRDAKVAAAQHHIKMLQEQIVKIMSRYLPQMTFYPDESLTTAPAPASQPRRE